MTSYVLALRVGCTVFYPEDYRPDDDEMIMDIVPDSIDLNMRDPRVRDFLDELANLGTVTQIGQITYPVGGEPFVDIQLHIADEEDLFDLLRVGLIEVLGRDEDDDVLVIGVRQFQAQERQKAIREEIQSANKLSLLIS
jgi:hypothetical protein